MGMHVLVTGGAGFVGRHLVERLKSNAMEVTVVDDFSSGPKQTLDQDVRLIVGDIRDESVLGQLPNNITDVFHLAGQTSAEASMKNPADDTSRNCTGTLSLIDWTKTHNLRSLTFASTMGVYGNTTGPVDEDAANLPESIYGANKYAAEQYLRINAGVTIEAITVLRLFNVYGPGQDFESDIHGMLGIYLGQMIRAGRVEVKGSLDRTRDFVFIHDVVQAFQLSLQDVASGEFRVFNIATGVETPVNVALELLMNAVGYRVPVSSEPATLGDISRSVGSSARFQRELGWKPTVPLESGIKTTVESVLGASR